MAARARRSSPSFSRHVAPFAPLALALAVGAGSNRGHQPPPGPPSQAAEAGFAQTCQNPSFPTDTATLMDGTSCSVSGNGGAETWQNEAKNNFCGTGAATSPTSPIAITIPEMAALQAKVQQIPNIAFGNTRNHPLTTKAGPIQDRAPLVAVGEGNLVQLEGYVKIARQEGTESVNCGKNVPDDPVYHDIHISIVVSSAEPECSGIVVEMTPHHRPATWTADLVNEVAAKGLLVRVTGQRMFDSSHTPCNNGSPVQGDPARVLTVGDTSDLQVRGVSSGELLKRRLGAARSLAELVDRELLSTGAISITLRPICQPHSVHLAQQRELTRLVSAVITQPV